MQAWKSALIERAEEVVKRARAGGADVAEAVLRQGSHLSAKVRAKAPELVSEADSAALGLRVMRGQQVAVAHSSDLSPHGLETLVADALELASLTEPDPHAGPPAPEALARDLSGAEMCAREEALALFDDPTAQLDGDVCLQQALQAETAAYDFDPRITHSEGATFARISGAMALVTSGGFAGAGRGTYASLVVQPVATDASGVRRTGHHWSAKRHCQDLQSPSAVGQEAARRTVAKLGARKIPSQQVPVIFDREAAGSILSLVASVVSGTAVWKQSSFLAERLGEKIASPLVHILDDPWLAGGPASRLFDGEGCASRQNTVVQAGTLHCFLLDTYAARKLGLSSNACASRSGSGRVSPGPSNFILQPGDISPEALIQSSPKALLVTEMMGFGFNPVTGDFSRGAAGFWVEGGELVHPVNEVTISLNLGELLRRIDAVANDLDTRSAIASPTLRVSEMTVAGS